jgi:hypothetical protein
MMIGVAVFWVAVIRPWWTGAPDRPMGLLDLIPVAVIWWIWDEL